jgi:hypothetical protein
MNLSGFSLKKIAAIGTIGLLAGGINNLSECAAGNTREEQRVIRYRTLGRSEIENLQRWVAAGHEAWCKDARLVAAKELGRIAPDFGGDATELNTADSMVIPSDAKKVTFEWTPLDARAEYRVTVERFVWLLPIAKDSEEIVWVPTLSEIRKQE